jgi:hypothetical protein
VAVALLALAAVVCEPQLDLLLVLEQHTQLLLALAELMAL